MWDQEADDACETLKKLLAEAPVLAAPAPKEPLMLYVTAGLSAVSAVVVVERKEEGKEYPVQRPVYYVSEVLSETKQRYPHWQKLVFGPWLPRPPSRPGRVLRPCPRPEARVLAASEPEEANGIGRASCRERVLRLV